ncbi:hypothetical protein [Paenarthrobacter ureafaciens]|jgi:hypothetical protein|uniref:hypothetical protein n=1 Tax=Paenarthrobacter ureafaciens TaxID=37931 RepID=UPI001C2BCEF0|nr:hypothetical protein [Paenarthrobacter ureafaciens]
MNHKSLVWLMLALLLGAYAVYALFSNQSGSVWPLLTGVICALGALGALWRLREEVRADRE